MADAQPSTPGRLTIRVAQVLLVASAAGLWAASRLTWVDLRTFDGLGPPKPVTLSGATWSSALLPLALLLLAAAIAVLAVRGWALRVLAVLVALASLAAGYLAVSTLEIPDVAVRAAELARVPLLELVGSNRHYPGPVITLASAVCTLASAALVMRAATTAGRTATKYLTPAARRSAAARDEWPMSERMIWDELDEGRDPTESAPPPDGNPPPDPDTEGR
ncbi:TIGR02234 family membrane protein [Mycobacterium sp.]|uniref:TIGR02234 family membrane protein n=1 Tax=Mycobacterium sp. TaxID=1785 RepID=UPI003BAF488A